MTWKRIKSLKYQTGPPINSLVFDLAAMEQRLIASYQENIKAEVSNAIANYQENIKGTFN